MNGRVRVVHLAAYGGSYAGSFIPMLEAARNAVESRGWSYEVVFTHGIEQHPWYSDLRAHDARTRVAPDMRLPAATIWLRRLLAEHVGSTVLHTHFSSWDIAAALAAGHRREAAVVWHIHTRIPPELAVRAKQLMRFGLAARRVDRVLCVAPEIRSTVLTRLAPARRTTVFANGIDVVRFARIRGVERSRARVRIGLPADGDIALIFAWDWDMKGGRLLLDSIRELRRRGRDVHAVVVGSEERARDAAASLNIEDLVHAIPPAEDARVLYGAADVFIAASFGEGMPFALLEALACGTPVVASDISGHRVAAATLPACRLVPRLTSAFADAIEAELSANTDVRESLLSESRARIESEFSLQTWSDRLIRVYEELLPRAVEKHA